MRWKVLSIILMSLALAKVYKKKLGIPWWFRIDWLFNLRRKQYLSIRVLDFLSHLVWRLVGFGPGLDFKRKRFERFISVLYVHPCAPGKRMGLNNRIAIWAVGDEISFRDIIIPCNSSSSGGGNTVPARFFWNASKSTSSPLIIFFHGGGFVVSSPKLLDYHIFCSKIASHGYKVLSVDYRLAPEHPFPAAVCDAYHTLRWIQSAESKDILLYTEDIRRIILIGDSAGGNLSAVMSSLIRDGLNASLEKEKLQLKIEKQILLYPGIDVIPLLHERSSASWLLSHEIMMMFYFSYLSCNTLKEIDLKSNDRRIRPSLAGYQKLPDTVIVVGDDDPLFAENKTYARELERAGNNVKLHEFPGEIHGFATFWFNKSSTLAFLVVLDVLKSC